MSTPQGELFGAAAGLPDGFVYVPDFIGADEEAALLEALAALPFEEARYRQFTARRRVVSFSAPPMPAFLLGLRVKVAAWLQLPEEKFERALINEYRPGTPLGWHRDAPDFEHVAGVSLGGWARMRLRPYSPGKDTPISLELAPRSAYRMQGAARWHWQHSVSATKTLRYSITLRTLRSTAS